MAFAKTSHVTTAVNTHTGRLRLSFVQALLRGRLTAKAHLLPYMKKTQTKAGAVFSELVTFAMLTAISAQAQAFHGLAASRNTRCAQAPQTGSAVAMGV
jgi:hypothetical protein